MTRALSAAVLGLAVLAGTAHAQPAATDTAAAPAFGSSSGGLPGAAGGAISSTLPGGSGVLPSTGLGSGPGLGSATDGLEGRLSRQFLGTPAPAGPENRRLTIRPGIGLSQAYTDNATLDVAGQRRDDYITTLTPSVAIQGDLAHATINLNYAPSLYYYANDHSQSRIAQNFDGRAVVNPFGGFFVDLRGSGSEQSRQGTLGPAGTNSLSRQDATQDYSFSVSPYYVRRFGGIGTGELGATYARTIQSGDSNSTARLNGLAFGQGLFLPALQDQNLTTTNAHLAFVTGEDLGRYNAGALLSGTQFDGSGVLDNAHRYVATLDNGYAITRTITALAQIGYEDLRFSGSQPIRINDAVWSIGVRLQPSPDTSVTVRYGHHDGLDAATLDASWAPTARTRVFARYSEGITTDQEEIQNALATSDLDARGATVDHTSGAPLFLASNFFGVQSTLYRARRVSVSGLLLFERDTAAVTIQQETRTVLSSSTVNTGGLSGSNEGIFVSGSVSHLLSPRLRSSGYLQYGRLKQTSPTQPATTSVGATAALSYLFGEKLYGSLQYSYNRVTNPLTIANVPAPNTTNSQSVVLASLVKTF